MGEDPHSRGASRRWIIREVENSLRRLRTDYIDLYQVHRPSPDTDVAETLGALTDLVRAGKVRYIGSSSYSASQIVEAQWASRERHLERFVTEQPPYSIMVRGIEEDVLPTTQRHGMGTLTYSPLAGGWLSGRWRKDAAGTPTSAARPSARFDMDSPANQRKLDIVEELAQLAEQTGITLIELAIAFAINHPGVTSAIVGPRTMEQLESYLPAADISLSADVLDRIDELVAPAAGRRRAIAGGHRRRGDPQRPTGAARRRGRRTAGVTGHRGAVAALRCRARGTSAGPAPGADGRRGAGRRAEPGGRRGPDPRPGRTRRAAGAPRGSRGGRALPRAGAPPGLERGGRAHEPRARRDRPARSAPPGPPRRPRPGRRPGHRAPAGPPRHPLRAQRPAAAALPPGGGELLRARHRVARLRRVLGTRSANVLRQRPAGERPGLRGATARAVANPDAPSAQDRTGPLSGPEPHDRGAGT